MTSKTLCEFWVASSVKDGGAYLFRLCEDETLQQIRRIPMDEPKYLELHGNHMWAVLMHPFEGKNESGIVCVDAESGAQIGEILPTFGRSVCHLAVDGEDVYAANYSTGNFVRLPDRVIQHTGTGPDPERQTCPHVHGTFLSPDKQYLLVCDLGLDAVFTYTRDLQLVSRAQTPPGAGPRHLCFSACGKYVYTVNEMGASVTVFGYADGILTPVRTVSILPGGEPGAGAGSAIKLSPDGTRLYATERVTRTIATLSVNGEEVQLLASTDSHGKEPRDFTLLANGKYAVSTNQFADVMALFRIDENGIPAYIRSYDLPAPLCAIEC